MTQHEDVPVVARSVRIPLSTGATAAGMLLFGMMTLIAALFGAGLVIPLARLDRTPDAHKHLLPLVPIMFFLASVFFHAMALRSRASDVLIGGDGLRIEGGPKHGTRYPWDALDLDHCRIETNHNAYIEAGSDRTYEQRLLLRLRGGGDQVLAASLDAAEQESLAALLETLLALGKGRPAGPPPPADEACVIACPGCQAPVVPVDAETARCRFCGADAPMNDEVRERLRRGREGQAAQRRAESRVERLLRRPIAGHTNRWLLGALTAKYLLPFALLLATRLWLFSLAMVWVLGRMVKMKLSARQVLQRLILDYTATPAAPGQPLLCRRCGGPLPAAEPGRVLSRCAYCDADNLVGLDVHQRASSAEKRAFELGALLLAERVDRVRHLAWICIGLGVAVYGLVRAL